MIDFFEKDSFLSGFVLALLLNILGIGIIYLALYLINMDVLLNLKLFIFSVVPSIFLLRYQIRQGKIKAFKGCVFLLIVFLLVIFIAFLKMNIFDNPFSQKIQL